MSLQDEVDKYVARGKDRVQLLLDLRIVFNCELSPLATALRTRSSKDLKFYLQEAKAGRLVFREGCIRRAGNEESQAEEKT